MPKVKRQSAQKRARLQREYRRERRRKFLLERSKEKDVIELRKLESYYREKKDSEKSSEISQNDNVYLTQKICRMSRVQQNDDFRQKEREKDRLSKHVQRQDPEKHEKYNDDTNTVKKIARLDPESGSKIREQEKEAKHKTHMNDLLRYNETFSSNISKKAKLGDLKSELYQHVLAKQRQTLVICTCCMHKLYDNIL